MIEDWQGVPVPKHRRAVGPVFVQPVADPSPSALDMFEGTRSVGIPTFENQNGSMRERAGGSSIVDVRFRDGKRQSVFRSYTFPYMDRPKSDGANSRLGHPDNFRRQACDRGGVYLQRQNPSHQRWA